MQIKQNKKNMSYMKTLFQSFQLKLDISFCATFRFCVIFCGKS